MHCFSTELPLTSAAPVPPQVKVKDIYSMLYQKSATYELPAEDVRQVLFELESCYNSFLATLRDKS